MLGLVPVPGVVMPFTLNMHCLKDINSWPVNAQLSCALGEEVWGLLGSPWNSQLCKTQQVVLGWAQLGCQHLVHLRCPEAPEALHGVAGYHTGPTWHPHSTGELVGVPGGHLGEFQWLRMLVYGNWAESVRSDSTPEKDPQLSIQRLH